MARTTILPTDANKRKAWAAIVAQDSAKDQYYARMIGPEGSRSALVRKTDTEAGRGDEECAPGPELTGAVQVAHGGVQVLHPSP